MNFCPAATVLIHFAIVGKEIVLMSSDSEFNISGVTRDRFEGGGGWARRRKAPNVVSQMHNHALVWRGEQHALPERSATVQLLVMLSRVTDPRDPMMTKWETPDGAPPTIVPIAMRPCTPLSQTLKFLLADFY